MASERNNPPLLLPWRSSSFWILSTVAVAIFADYFLYGVLVPVLPFALVEQSGVEQHDVQRWTSILLAIYGGTTCLFSPLCGYAADCTTSRRFPLLVGLVVQTGATVLLCVGRNLPSLIIGRILQGFSGAVVYAVGPALVVDTVQSRNVSQAMGWIGWAMNLGTIVSPLLGGLVFDRAGYTAVFAMVFALIGTDALLRFGMIEKKIAAAWLPAEPAEDIETVGHVSEPQAVCREKEKPGPKPVKRSSASKDRLWSILGASSPHIESFSPQTWLRRLPQPSLLSLIKDVRFLIILWGIFAQAILLTSFDAVLALFVERTFHWSASAAGLTFLPLLLPAFFGPAIGHLSDRYGASWPVISGFAIATPGFVCLRFVTYDALEQKVLLCALLFIDGLAITAVLVPLMGEVATVIDDKKEKKAYGQGYGLFNVAFGGGVAAGPLIAGPIVNQRGWAVMALTLGCLSAVSAVIMFTRIRGKVTHGSKIQM